MTTTEITLAFADGRYRFFLPMTQLNEFEAKHGSILSLEPHLRAGIALDTEGRAIYTGGGEAEAKAIREVVRQALIGGNRATIDGVIAEVGPNRARELVDAYVYPAQPLGDGAALAWRILAAAIYGTEPEAEEGKGAPDV